MEAIIIGASGYTGRELVRILDRHEKIDTIRITSRKYVGKTVNEVHPSLDGIEDIIFEELDMSILDSDIAFLAVPHTDAMHYVPDILEKGIKIIDLSADFRLKNKDTYQKYYKTNHSCPEYIEKAVYGLPEYYRNEIKKASLIANPGCYPTSTILASKPLTDKTKVKHLIIDSKSGVSGAGVKNADEYQKFIQEENFKAYKIIGHQHTPEIEQELGMNVSFTPHLAPINQGIFTTIHAITDACPEEVKKTYEKKYGKEPFVEIIDDPDVLTVRDTNMCQIGGFQSDGTHIVITSTIDNLIKGASGQAVQNMNLMMGYTETEGLE